MHFIPHLLLALAPQGPPEAPFSLYTDAQFPAGLDFGNSTGISFGDWNADGWPDVFSFSSGNLWRNDGGLGWSLVYDMDLILTTPGVRYGSSFGDYDNDGLPDIGTEPREGLADDCFHLLKNLGNGPNFVDVAGIPQILDAQPCGADSETISWADVDGDGDLDMFLPIYPPGVGSIDNKFLHNLGPTGPNGAHRFSEKAAAVGLLVPAGNARPEGSWFFDADRDGDLDLYSNGGLYRNLSSLDAPLFESLPPDSSGIRKRSVVDEGTVFADFDMDGDEDLLISYTFNKGLRIWEARGDGTYAEAPTSLIEDYQNGASFGLSAADWDMDGDIDLQAQQTWRRNLLMETGTATYELLATSNIDPNHTNSATVAWGDWDRDGDPDAVLGNGARGGWLYRNDSYDVATPLDHRRDLRLRLVRDSAAVARGLETEYGAAAELRVRGEEGGPRRRQLLSSAAGYLTQNEYALTFALPADPAPADPDEDVRFDVQVDFPTLPDQGYRRVDRFANPALGGLDLAALGADRQLDLARSGALSLHGCVLAPAQPGGGTLRTTAGGLAVPTASAFLPDPAAAPDDWWFGGVEIDTTAAAGPLLLRELIVDGRLGAPVTTPAGSANVMLWDVSTPGSPALVPRGAWSFTTGVNNRREHLPVDALLQPGRVYRLVARLADERASAVSGPVAQGAFTTTGGLWYRDTTPATGAGAAGAVVDPTSLRLAARIDPAPVLGWRDLGNGLAGAAGVPQLNLDGGSSPGDRVDLRLSGAAPNARVWVVLGDSIGCAPVADGFLVPEPGTVIRNFRTGPNGALHLAGLWPAGHPHGAPLFVQVVVADPGAPRGFAATRALARLGGY